MATDIDEVLSEFDDLSGYVSHSKHDFFSSNLRRWFAFIDSAPGVANITRKLEGSVDFEDWRKEGLKPQSGTGHGRIILPERDEERLGALIGLFRSFTANEQAAWEFAHGYVSSAKNINENIADLVDQIFIPLVRDLRRKISRELTTQNEVKPETIPLAVPASDRIVDIDHNNPAYSKVLVDLGELREAVRGENNFDDPDDKGRCLAEIDAVPTLLRARKVRIAALGAVAVVLTYLVATFTDTAVGRLAGNAINKLLELVPALTPFLG